MKNFKTTIIALVVLCVAIGAYICVSIFVDKDDKGGEGDEQNTSLTSVYLFDVNADEDGNYDVSSIEANNEEFFSIYKTDDSWYSKSHTNLEIYSESVNDIIGTFVEIRGNLITDFESLDDFRIDEKSPYTKLVFKDGTSLNLRFGTTDHNSSYRYVCVEGRENEVYRILESTASKVMITRGLLVRLTAFNAEDGFNASHLTIKRKGETVIDAMGQFVTAGSEDDKDTIKWTILKPIRITGDDSSINALVKRLTDIQLEALVDGECDDLSEYGLDQPLAEYYIIYTNDKGETQSNLMKLGKKTKDTSSYYCTIDDNTSAVYRVSASMVSADVKIETYINGNIFQEMYTSLKSIDFTFGKESHTMKFVFKEENDKTVEERYFDGVFVPSGEDSRDDEHNTPEDYFTHLHSSLYMLEISSVEVDEPDTKGELLCKVVYTRTDNTKVILELYKRDNATAYIYKDGVYAGGYLRTGIRLYGEYQDYGVEGSLEKLKDAMK